METIKTMIEQVKAYFTNPDTYWNIIAIVVYLIFGYIAVRLIRAIFKKIFEHNKRMDRTLKGFLTSFITFILYLIYFTIFAKLLGISDASIVAILGSVGLALSLALQDSLGSLANGIVILFNKPFKEGDWIAVDGVEGSVKCIHVINTELNSIDNKRILIPNSHITTQTLTNYSVEGTRRVGHEIGVAYDTDVNKLESVLTEIVKSDDRILVDPSFGIKLSGFGSSELKFNLTYWVKTSDYWGTYWDTNRKILEKFRENGIEIPYQQIDITLKNNQINGDK